MPAEDFSSAAAEVPMRRVVVLGDFEQQLTPAVAQLLGSGYHVNGYYDVETNESVLRTRLEHAQVIVVIRERIGLSKRLVDSLEHLELLVTTGRGNTVIPHNGPPLLATGSMASAPAEHTWALILGLARDIPGQQQRLRDGNWQDALGMGLADRTLGVIGLGRIGQRVAEVARAFGMNVLAYSPSLDAEKAAALRVEYAPLDELAERSDVISLHAKLTSTARGLVDESFLARMKSHALLVNTARAALVDSLALEKALNEGRIGGFAQDVFEEEPLPLQDPLRELPRTLFTPHIGYATDQNFELFAEHVAEDIAEFYSGNLVRSLNHSTG